MILVHRLRGEPVIINCDLIEMIESTPDTVLTMIDGKRMVVTESPGEVTERIRDHRAAVIASSAAIRSGERATLFVVDGGLGDDSEPEVEAEADSDSEAQ